MGTMCWDLNPNCMAKAEGEKKRPCPSYEQKIGCWELDWKSLVQSVSAEEKKMMGQWMRDNCPKCPVYPHHHAELQAKLNAIDWTGGRP